MNIYKLSVIVPVLYLSDYSRKVLLGISEKTSLFPEICFVLPCSENATDQLKDVFFNNSRSENVIMAPCKINNSNFLRYQGMLKANTEYVYYQDCDDEVDYQTLISEMNRCTGENVVCFNINRRQYDEHGNLIDERHLYPDSDYGVKKINMLMTNIVNKLIPKKYLETISYYDLPFSQDWCISYQLFLQGPHYYVSKLIYSYENNTQSTAGYKKTKMSSLIRVCAMKRIISKMYREKNRNNDALFLEYRYDVMLESRFYYLNKPYFPSYKIGQFNPFVFGAKEVVKHFYHVMLSCRLATRYYCKRLFNKNRII